MVAARSVWMSSLSVLVLIAGTAFAQETKPKPADADPFAAPPAEGFGGKLSLVFGSGQKVHEQKSKVEKALQQNATLDFVQTPLADVAAYLQDAHGIPILINAKKLEEANISVDTPIDLSLSNIRLETALDLVTRKLGATYDVTDEIIEITTLKDLQARPRVRLYDCRDLLALLPDGTPAQNPAGLDVAQPVAPSDAESLIQTITRTVDASSWNTQSGSGTIENFKGMLVVSHTSRAHRQIEKLLNTIRETAGLEPRAGKAVE